MMHRLAVALVGLGAGLAVTAADAKETTLKSEVVATESINPNRRGTPQPVKVHIFYLAEDEAFLEAGFADLIDTGSTLLGDELVRRTEQLIAPGERLELDEQFDEAAQYIGVVAAFTNLDGAGWQAIAAVPEKRWTNVLKLFRSSKLQIVIDGTNVSCAIVED